MQEKMQLFIRGTQTHTLQIAGEETVQDVKVCMILAGTGEKAA